MTELPRAQGDVFKLFCPEQKPNIFNLHEKQQQVLLNFFLMNDLNNEYIINTSFYFILCWLRCKVNAPALMCYIPKWEGIDLIELYCELY